MPVERTTEERELTDLSVSRVSLGNKCGLAFKYRYVDRLPAPYDTGSKLFGSAIHRGVERWYGGDGVVTDENERHHKETSLVGFVNETWPELLPPRIWEHIRTLLDLEEERMAVAEAIKLQRPELKAPMQTKAFLSSAAHKEFTQEREAMNERADKLKEVKWPQDEDPFAAYQKAQLIATRLERHWQPLPRPLVVEEPFRLEFEGYVLRGAIDQVRRDPDLDTGTLGPIRVVDLKSGRNLMTQMEAFVQAFIYNEAARQIGKLETDIMEFWLVRHVDARGRTKVQRGELDRPRHDKLALNILNGVARRIITGGFEPHYGFHCKSCDFRDMCESEINLWEGDGLMLEPEAGR